MAPSRKSNRGSPHQGKGKGKQRVTDSTDDTAPSASGGSQSAAKPEPSSTSLSTHWTVEDEDTLIELALEKKAMMGSNGSFRGSFWSEVASNFPHPRHGKPKTADSCKEKWKRMKNIYDVVNKIAHTSGLHYSLNEGTKYKPECLHVWETFISQNKGAQRFKKKGWIYYNKMCLLLPSKQTGKAKFTVQVEQSAPTLAIPSTSQLSVSSPSLAAHQSATTPSGASTVSHPITPQYPEAEMNALKLGPNDSMVSTATWRESNTTSHVSSPLSSTFQPPSIPSSCVNSTVSSVWPSSSVSARVVSKKRKADDDDISMTGPASGSVVSGVSRVSSSRKRQYTSTTSRDITSLREDISTLQSSFHTNTQFMEHMIHSNLPRVARTSNPSSQLEAMGEKKNRARSLLLDHEQDFLSTDEMIVMLDVLGKNSDYVETYLLLATSQASTDELRQQWLKKRLAEASTNTT
ncbi:hypothetical protein JVT61DRAFT_6276 [Boletus reticuloceps]|uniref:Myb-like domain-containing protein n=1 Tax=Boletus reticuloceps TaxID=495285 RepID=A0A8I2YK50_9AGAM|nr:hypothetical protein JVT61DRAFT_6276 [Boletus reticuloceps]